LVKSTATSFIALLLLAAISLPHSLSANANLPVDINSASLSALLRIDGMTVVWAQRIVRFRPYSAKSDLVQRGIVSREEYQRIENRIVAHQLHRP
jgi:predicted DNA-binding helix-hairpin-helix protein